MKPSLLRHNKRRKGKSWNLQPNMAGEKNLLTGCETPLPARARTLLPGREEFELQNARPVTDAPAPEVFVDSSLR
jgi:hypothetical protein